MEKIKLMCCGVFLGVVGVGFVVGVCFECIDCFELLSEGYFCYGVVFGDFDQISVMLWIVLSDDGGGYCGVELVCDVEFQDIIFEQGEMIMYVVFQLLGMLKILVEGLLLGMIYFYCF